MATLCYMGTLQLPLPKGTQPPIFSPYLLSQNGCLDQDATCREVGVGPSNSVLDEDLAPHTKKGPEQPEPNFRPMYIVAKRMNGSRCHLVWR